MKNYHKKCCNVKKCLLLTALKSQEKKQPIMTIFSCAISAFFLMVDSKTKKE